MVQEVEAAGTEISTSTPMSAPSGQILAKWYHTCNPDGHIERLCLLVNNQYPGPTIHASWGDILKVTVVTQMQDNGTSLHFHGLRQLGSNAMDGTNGITECPLAPGESKTYTFQATQHGSSWYHSHYSAQYGDGVMGAIVIDGPATANYDIDFGSFIVNEWYYQTAFQINFIVNARLQLLPTGDLPASGPPASDNILINGTNKNTQGSGKYGKTIMEQGKRYRLRIINTAVDNALRVSLDGHPFEVVSADFVPIKPFVTDTLLLNIGQRYDVVITANQTIGNYWFRATVDEACRAFNHGKGLSIFSYAGANSSDPTTTGPTFSSCNDEVVVPWWPMTVPSSSFSSQAQDLAVDVQQPGVGTNGASVVAWNINMTAQDVSWETPVLSYVYNHTTKYPVTENLLSIPNEDTWVYWIIQETASSAVPIPHPIHLHGHDFYVLGTGQGQWNSSSPMNFETSPRRDSAILPGGGYLVIAFLADNPGAWLMHCHIAWHISEGLGVTFLESASTIPPAAAGAECTNNKGKPDEQ
ncbi:hypothetical protein B0A49_00226 [Cryomyces minteri]|uniref:laccase n=1 Tax=Cryomyces minteri TaxID=331657 RepID=A0A4U0XU08_9PEZI|nr:hypothetical protein B0A49_00226 [Cryomyces minteri]